MPLLVTKPSGVSGGLYVSACPTTTKPIRAGALGIASGSCAVGPVGT